MHLAKRGMIGEAAVLNAFIQRGFEVLTPFGDGLPYDLVVPIGDAFLRIQCKTGWAQRGCVLFNAYATDHGRGQVSYVGKADLFGVYFPPSAAVYLVPIRDVTQAGRLRLQPPRNNQRRRVRWAADYEIDRWTPETLHAVVAGDQPDRLSLTA
jgi:hypothetical protein